MARKSRGRQKVEMVKMNKESNLQVTFSKRRSGLFKKASELCTLCGAEVAIVVFSPGKKVFSFGHPGVEGLINRYLAKKLPQSSGALQLIQAHRNANVQDLNLQLTQVLQQLEMEKKRSEELNEVRKARQIRCWWEATVEELSLPQLEQLKASLEDLKMNVVRQADKVLLQTANPHKFFGPITSGGVLPFDQRFMASAADGSGAGGGGGGGGMVAFDQKLDGSSSCYGGMTTFDRKVGGFNPNMVPHGGLNLGFGRGFF